MFLTSHNPSTGDALGRVPVASAEDVAATVARARAAQPAWRALGARERAAMLLPAGEALVSEAASLGRLLSQEQGKPLREAMGEARGSGAGLAAELDEIVEALAPTRLDDGRSVTTMYRDPLGVCLAITPWNFPLSMPHWLVIPALVAGNTVVLKPSEETPLIAAAYVEILQRYLPEGVLQIVHGDGEQGRMLVGSDVDLIAFTGSRRTGQAILQACAGRMTRVLLELGGKDPLVVLPDAEIEAAARFAARNSLRNAGQVCVSTERIFVSRAAAPAFEAALVRHASAFQVGDGLEDGVRMGPMIHGRQRALVVEHVRDALDKGARLLLGGQDLDSEGNFLQPIVVSDVRPDMRIMQEETFGPVACVTTYEDVDEAVRQANDHVYALGAVVFGQDMEQAEAVARRLDAGMVGINRGVGGAKGSPWVGAKQSGYGFHSGVDGHRQFAQTRIVTRASS